MQRLENKKSRTRSASTRRQSKFDKDVIFEEPTASERLSRPRITENFTNITLNEEQSCSRHDSIPVKKRNSIFNQLSISQNTNRKSLGPLLDLELSKHACQTGGTGCNNGYSSGTNQFKAQVQLQIQPQDLAITQAKLFAEACAQAMAKADEIAQIEADAQLTYVPPDFHENIQQSLNRSRSSSKNVRRLPILPQQRLNSNHNSKKESEKLKKSQSSFSNRSKSYEHHKRVSFITPKTIQENEKRKSIDKSKQQDYDAVEKLLIREQLLKKQRELLAQDRLTRRAHQVKNQLEELQLQKRSSFCSPKNNYIY